MISKPSTPHYVINTAHVSRYQKAFQDFQQIYSPVNRTKDVEHSIPLDERAKALVEKRGGPDLSHWRIVDEVWHYSSVDWGKRCEFLLENASWCMKRSFGRLSSRYLCRLQLTSPYRRAWPSLGGGKSTSRRIYTGTT